jgi:hypothetical protein
MHAGQAPPAALDEAERMLAARFAAARRRTAALAGPLGALRETVVGTVGATAASRIAQRARADDEAAAARLTHEPPRT